MKSNPKLDLTGKVAVITGASRGIGEAIAKAYAGAGARVVLSSRKTDKLELIAEEIRSAGGEAVAIPAHTGDPEAVERLGRKTEESFGGIDILVNNAGTNPHFGPLLDVSDAAWDKTFEVNLKGYFRMSRICARSMQSRGGGKIINMSSVAGKTPQTGMGVYCLTKAAVNMLTAVLAVELAGDNIQVNAIAPGFIKTQFSRALWGDQAQRDKILALTPQRRFAEAHELVGTALYLASEASSFVTGTTIVVDGGLLAGRTFSG